MLWYNENEHWAFQWSLKDGLDQWISNIDYG